jgi:hypothetical protein
MPSMSIWKIITEDGSMIRKRVGWVERSDTHQLRFVEMMGFAGLNPSHGLRTDR